MPENFSANTNAHDFVKGWDCAGIVPFAIADGDPHANVLRYWRHGTKKKDSDKYLEGLSGTQSYLSTLAKVNEYNYALLARLVENSLMRILIVDERTREFLEKHSALKSTYQNMGIYVANDKKVAEEMELIGKGHKVMDSSYYITNGLVNLSANVIYKVGKEYPGASNINNAKQSEIVKATKRFKDQFECIVIHQGIIDKWLPGASHEKAKVEAFIKSLKRVFKYVVITTGRGTPANIPDSGRVLPFSTIQTTLFKQYPEKLILTDAIMNSLPVKTQKKGDGHGFK